MTESILSKLLQFFFCQYLMRLIQEKNSNLKVKINKGCLQPSSLKKVKSNESWRPLFFWRYILTILWIFYTFQTDKTAISFCILTWFVYEQKIVSISPDSKRAYSCQSRHFLWETVATWLWICTQQPSCFSLHWWLVFTQSLGRWGLVDQCCSCCKPPEEPEYP